jgi:hypothetical protein
MNDRAARTRIRILSDEETRFWHSRFNRHYREIHQTRIVERCEEDARHCGFAGYAIYDAYETLVAHGPITPAA